MKLLREIGTPKTTTEHAAMKDPATHSISVLNGQLVKAALRYFSAIFSTSRYCIIIAALLVLALQAAPFPWIRYWDFSGPRTVIAGSRTIYTLEPRPGFHYTIDGTTSIATVTGGVYTPINGDIFYPDGGSVNTVTGNLPAGITTTLNGAIDDTTTTVVLTSGAGITNGDGLFIDTEQLTCTSISVNTCTVVRNVASHAAHADHASVLDTNTGLYTMMNGVWPVYAVCDAGVGGAGTFHLKLTAMNYANPDPCTGQQLVVTSAGTATLTASLITSANIYVDADPTGFPVGTTFTYEVPSGTSECNGPAPLGGGTKPYSLGQGRICIIANVPLGSTPGTYTSSFTFCTVTTTPCPMGDLGTFSWTIDVVARPNISYAPPSNPTTPTALPDFEAMMIARPCPNSACGTQGMPSTYSGPANYIPDTLANPSPPNLLGAAVSSGVCMYGWCLSLDNMAIYTGNMVYRTGGFQTGMGNTGVAQSILTSGINTAVTTIPVAGTSGFVVPGNYQIGLEELACTAIVSLNLTCSRSLNNVVASHSLNDPIYYVPDLQSVRTYVTLNPTAPGPDYMNFAESLFRAARVFGDSTYATAGLLLQNNPQVSLGVNTRHDLYRPVVWGLNDAVALNKYGMVTGAHWQDQRDGLYSMALQSTESVTAQKFIQQNFINGVAAYGIIADWQLSADPRAVYTVKRIADEIWSNYDQANHIWMNLPGPDFSPWCANPHPWFFSSADGDGNCGSRPLNWQQLQIHGITANWWYYAYTGDTTYRDRGDELFNHVLDDVGNSSGYALTGKNDSEIFFHFFNAITWRKGLQTVSQWYGDASTVHSIPHPGNMRVPGNLRAAIKDLDRMYLPDVRLLAKHE